MLDRRRRHLPSPALVVSCLALFVATSGLGYAAVRLPAGSVGPKHLKKNAVTSVKVKDRSLTGADLALGTVTGANLAPNAVSGSNLAPGAVSGGDLASDSVTGDTISNGSLLLGDLAVDSFTQSISTPLFALAGCDNTGSFSRASVQAGDVVVLVPPSSANKALTARPEVQASAGTVHYTICATTTATADTSTWRVFVLRP